MPTIQEYIDSSGNSPFARAFDRLGHQAAAKVSVAIARLEDGNDSNVKSVGGGVLELRIHARQATGSTSGATVMM